MEEHLENLFAKYGILPISGGSGDDDPEDDPEEDDDDEDDPAPGGGKPAKPSKPKSYSEDEVQRLIRDRLKRDRESTRTKVLAEVERQAEEAAAAKRGEFDKLLAAKEREIKDLSSKAGVVEEYEELARQRWAELKKTLPEPILALAPDDDATPLELERWYTTKALPAIEKLDKLRGKKGLNPDDDPDPKKKDREKRLQDYEQEYRRAGTYKF